MSQKYWIAFILVVLGLVVLGAYLNGNKGPKGDHLTRHEEAGVKANIGKDTKAADQKVAGSVRAAAAAAPLRATGKEAGKQAATIRTQTHQKLHAISTSVSDTTAERIQRQWASYGDR